MTLDVYFREDDHIHWNPVPIYKHFFYYLVCQYPDIHFNHINSAFAPEKKPGSAPCERFSHWYMEIRNPENKKFLLISYWDKARNIFEKESDYAGFDIENLVELFTSTGIHGKNDETYDLCDPPLNYTPISFCHLLPKCDQIIKNIKIDDSKKNISEKLKFRGFFYSFREHLSKDPRFEIIDSRYNRLHIEEYLKELNESYINLSLSAKGEISNREIDILGLGNVLIRPKLRVKFHNELIPDYHYVSVDVPDFSDYETLANATFDRFEKIKSDKDYLNFISSNGHRWYLENGPSYKNFEILTKTVNINKLWKQ